MILMLTLAVGHVFFLSFFYGKVSDEKWKFSSPLKKWND